MRRRFGELEPPVNQTHKSRRLTDENDAPSAQGELIPPDKSVKQTQL